MDYGVIVIGAGPAGLSAAIRMKRLALQHGGEFSVAVIEQCSQLGPHNCAGDAIHPGSITEL